MGTHPIFESDFDCLTENVNSSEEARYCRGRSMRKNMSFDSFLER